MPGFQSVTRNYDDRGVTETPLGFPKVWNINPLVIPATWDVKYE